MHIVPAWKNAAYHQSLGAQAPLSAHLIGEVELTDADLETVHGSNGSGILNHNLSDNNINVLQGPNTILNNVGILGIGSSNCSNQGSHDCHRRQC